jgi:hypothetical protein
MSRSRLAWLCVVSAAIAAYGPLALGQAYPRIVAIGASVGGPSVFVIEDATEKVIHTRSSRAVIQRALLPVLLTGAHPVNVELEPGSSVIKRVDAFALPTTPGPVAFDGDYVVSRIATQRQLDGTGEHLEVFLKKNNVETAYNVYDPLLQQLLIAAFEGARIRPLHVDVQFDGPNNTDIATVHLGKKFSD